MAEDDSEKPAKSDLSAELADSGQSLESLKQALANAGVDLDGVDLSAAIQEVKTYTRHSGPLPAPNTLAEYDDVQSGLAEKIINSWEVQRDHRMRLETTATERAETRMDKSQRNSVIVAVLGLLVACAVGIWGSPWASGLIAIASVGGPGAFTLAARYLPSPRE